MLNRQPAAGILEYLLQTHNPRAIIITGSYADGTYTEASDFDCWLIGRDKKTARHDTSIVNGVQLQAEIYPMHYFMNMPLRRAEKQDFNGDLRGHLLLFQTAEAGNTASCEAACRANGSMLY